MRKSVSGGHDVFGTPPHPLKLVETEGGLDKLRAAERTLFFPPRVLHPPLRVTELRNVDFAIHATLLSNKGWSRCQVHVLAVEIKQ